MCRVAGADVASAPFTKKGRWQMADGRWQMERSDKKNFSCGFKAHFKEIFVLRSSRCDETTLQ
jgi:hypothetical protein